MSLQIDSLNTVSYRKQLPIEVKQNKNEDFTTDSIKPNIDEVNFSNPNNNNQTKDNSYNIEKILIGTGVALTIATAFFTKKFNLLNKTKIQNRNLVTLADEISTGYKSPEMKQIVSMNQEAVRQIKQPVQLTFSKATPKDLVRLTDTSLEASSKRCLWTNPQNGLRYNLLINGKTKSGKNIIRILDENGKYIKTVKLQPKKIIIIDDFSNTKAMTLDDYFANFSGENKKTFVDMGHGDNVKVLAQRSNPFAEFEIFNIGVKNQKGLSKEKEKEILDLIQKRIDAGEKIDYISCSYGSSIEKQIIEEGLGEFGLNLKQLKCQDLNIPAMLPDQVLISQFASKNPNVRILMSSGNEGAEYVSMQLMAGNIHGVGSLTPTGKVSSFSSSRNRCHTQHYELGEYSYTATPHGISLTGGKTTEIPFAVGVADDVLKFHGKKPNLASAEEVEQLATLEEAYRKVICPKNSYEVSLKESALQEWDEYINRLASEGKMIESKGEYYLPYNWIESLVNKKLKTSSFMLDNNGNLMIADKDLKEFLKGTSFSTPVRSAKLALNDMLEDIL